MARNRFVRIAVVAYAGVGLFASLLILVVLGKPETLLPGLGPTLGGVVIGLGAAVPVEILSIVMFRKSGRTRGLADEIAAVIGPVGTPDIFLVALASGFSEEIVFRGLIQPLVSLGLGAAGGLLVASIAFGLMHIPPKRRYAGWMVFAGVMGFYLGLLYLWTGNIIAPAITHVAVNFLNLHVVARIEPLTSWFRGAPTHP